MRTKAKAPAATFFSAFIFLIGILLIAGSGEVPFARATSTDQDKTTTQPSSSENNADLERAKALSNEATKLQAQGKNAEALKLMDQALELRKKHLPKEHKLIGECFYNMGFLHYQSREYDAAAADFEKAVGVFEKALGAEHYYTGLTQRRLADSYREQGKYSEAETAYKASIAIMEKAKGRDSMETAYAIGMLGYNYYKQEKYEQALAMYQQELAIKEKVKGRKSAEVAAMLKNVADCHDRLSQFDLAEKFHRESLATLEKTMGRDHKDTLKQLANLAYFFYKRQQYDKALPLHERLAAGLKKAKPPDARLQIAIVKRLGDIQFHLGNPAEAEKWYLEAISLYEKDPPTNADIAMSAMTDLGGVYRKQNQVEKAQIYYQKALDVAESVYGRDHRLYAKRLMDFGAFYYNQNQYEPARELFEKGSAILEKDPEAAVEDRATAFYNLGRTADATNRFKQGLEYYQKAHDLRKKALGPGAKDTIESLAGVAGAYQKSGDIRNAEKTFLEARELCRANLSPEDSLALYITDKLGQLYAATFRFEQAEPLLAQVLMARAKVFGSDHPLTAESHHNLARMYESRGNLTASADHLKKGIAIFEKKAPDNWQLMAMYRLWSKILMFQGEYDQAVKVLQTALNLTETNLGERANETAECLIALGEYHDHMGDKDEAVRLFEQALEIKQKNLGVDAYGTAKILQLIAMAKKIESPQRIELLTKALHINEKGLGENSPVLFWTLANLAQAHNRQGNTKEAEACLKRALVLGEKLGPQNPLIMGNYILLTTIYSENGEYDLAEENLKKVAPFIEKVLGTNSPANAPLFGMLGIIDAAKGRYYDAHENFQKAMRIQEQYIDQVMGFESEERKLKYLIQANKGLHYFLSNMVLNLNTDQKAVRDGLDTWLRRKGIILDAQQRFQEALVYGENKEAIKVFQELAGVRARISKLVFSQEYQQAPDRLKKQLDDLNARRLELESKLSRLSQAYAQEKKKSKADARQVASSLPRGSALVEFARLRVADFKTGRNSWLPDRYLAFIIHDDPKSAIRLIDLGEADKIDQAIQRFKKAVTNLKDLEGREAAVQGLNLYNSVFSPLLPSLENVKMLFVAPDGNLNLIPFEVLNTPDGRYLIDDYTFNYLSSGRDLLGLSGRKPPKGKALLLGDPDFDLAGKGKTAELRKLKIPPEKTEVPNQRSADFRGLKFTSLDGTRGEVQAIGKILGGQRTRAYLGPQALEEILFKTDSPSILHLATHGFFLDDVDFSAIMRRPGLAPDGDTGLSVENPLLRSGLALAGANTAFQVSSKGYYDGLLTAEKILGLRLRNTDLVVLSACETGLGEVRSGEGVYGLRRAFSQAGAKGIVMSMWSVPDKETMELMVTFYQNIASGKSSPSQALRQAALNQKQTCRERYGHTNPLFWGAFVYLGQP